MFDPITGKAFTKQKRTMTQEEFDRKWGDIDPWDIKDEDVLEQYKNDCFKMWEEIGFREKYQSLTDPNEPYNGIPFRVIRRAMKDEFDLICLPAWLIEFENGEQTHCYPDEICNVEKRNNARPNAGRTVSIM